MANVYFTQTETVNGFKPVDHMDLTCFSHIGIEQSETMSALFSAIKRLTDDKEIQALCSHGSLQADMLSNDIGVILECADKAGIVGKVVAA